MNNIFYYTQMILWLEPTTHKNLKIAAKIKKISIYKLIREGIILRLDQINKENGYETE